MKKFFVLICLLLLTSCQKNNDINPNLDDLPSRPLIFEYNGDVEGYFIKSIYSKQTDDSSKINNIINYLNSLELYLVDDWEINSKDIYKDFLYGGLMKTDGKYVYSIFIFTVYEDHVYLTVCEELGSYDSYISYTYRSKEKYNFQEFENTICDMIEV